MTSVLGVYFGHDPAACLVRDGQVKVLIEEERLTRVKHGLPKQARELWRQFSGRFGYFPWASVSYCLAAEGLGLDDLDLLVLPEAADATALAAEVLPLRDRSRIWVSREPAGGSHHWRHALSAFFASPFPEAAVLVVDGDGTVTLDGYEAETGYRFPDRSGRWEEVFKNRYPEAGLRAGLGWTYEYVSALLGFVAGVGYLGEPGKTMGLAPYGGPCPDLEGAWIEREGFRLAFRRFHDWLVSTGNHERLRFDSRELALIRDPERIPRDARDLAWKVQDELERALLGLAGELGRVTGSKHLCLAGGVALNSVANARILREGPFSSVFIQPAAHDAGQALGLAWAGWLELAGRAGGAALPALAAPGHAYGGRSYPAEDCKGLLRRAKLPFRELRDPAALAADAAKELAAGRLIGWFQGGSEYGPRALGHRSILADPRPAGMKDHLNARVKFREGFRPFAPAVLRERAGEVFQLEGESPYMLLVVPVHEAWRERVPAITHVDGTARVQTVDRAVEPLFHALIEAFAAETGVPLVLNTSFNLRGMPVVETPEDALRCFLYTELDVLYLGRVKLERPDPARLVALAADGWRFEVEERLSWSGREVRARWAHDTLPAVEVSAAPELVRLCRLLDGKRGLGEALTLALDGQPPPPPLLEAALVFLRRLLRAGAVRLALGELEL